MHLTPNLARQLEAMTLAYKTHVCSCGHADYVHEDVRTRQCAVPCLPPPDGRLGIACHCMQLTLVEMRYARPLNLAFARELRMTLGYPA